jgi:hypothetical protein
MRPAHLAPEHGQLVPEHEQLDNRRTTVAGRAAQQQRDRNARDLKEGSIGDPPRLHARTRRHGLVLAPHTLSCVIALRPQTAVEISA